MALSDLLDFEEFNLKKILDEPERLLLGAVDPFGTKLWNTVLDKDEDPLVNALGRPHKSTFEEAEAAGIDVDTADTVHDIASIVSAAIAGGYGAGKLSGVAGSASGSGGAASSSSASSSSAGSSAGSSSGGPFSFNFGGESGFNPSRFMNFGGSSPQSQQQRPGRIIRGKNTRDRDLQILLEALSRS